MAPLNFGSYDRWKLAGPDDDIEEPEIRCEVCDEMFVADEEHQVVHHECWCEVCCVPRPDCCGYCEFHGTHLTDASSPTHESFVCEACESKEEYFEAFLQVRLAIINGQLALQDLRADALRQGLPRTAELYREREVQATAALDALYSIMSPTDRNEFIERSVAALREKKP